ncbi:uncharacterized protein LOC123523929 [Mercenaria mercenaria]|uniref:uncharacterized protein LOC123523929 n=1 Tax=Mercenaria mercenaria TaxID=6596 RepID=UPI00234FAC0A|nr:uncharacterized protein LOC123523929 [Mercenaria mercenaria]
MQSASTKTKFRRQPVSSKKTSKGKSTQGKSNPERRNSAKRVLKDKGLKERAVRFRSTDEEFVFEIDPFDKTVIPDGSDIFQSILKEMKGGDGTAEDDEVFDGVFTATVTVDRLEMKSDVKKPPVPRKSILKRRSSSRR